MSNPAAIRQTVTGKMEGRSRTPEAGPGRTADRSRVGGASGQYSCRLLWHDDAAQAGGQSLHSGSATHYHPALGAAAHQGNRKGLVHVRISASRRRTTAKSFVCRCPRSPKNAAKNSARSARNTAKTRKSHIRGFRRDANEELKKLQKDAKLTEDELRKSETDIQKLTDQYIQKIDDAIKKKEQEILEV